MTSTTAGGDITSIEHAVIDQARSTFLLPEIVAGILKAALVKYDKISEADERAALQQIDPLWDELLPMEQARIVLLMIELVDIGTGCLNVGRHADGRSGFANHCRNNEIDAAARTPDGRSQTP